MKMNLVKGEDRLPITIFQGQAVSFGGGYPENHHELGEYVWFAFSDLDSTQNESWWDKILRRIAMNT